MRETERAAEAAAAVRAGDVGTLRRLLAADPGLATARVDGQRTLLHVATDWPGHVPTVAATVEVLVAAGADLDAPFLGEHRETPLHWAASSNDLAALEALLAAGATLDADGGVIGGGSPLADATAFGQWDAAGALLARGARASVFDLAALGRTAEVLTRLDEDDRDLDVALWAACHGGRLSTARALADRGADLHRLAPWEPATPLDAAERSGAADVVAWLEERGARRGSPR